MKLLSKPISLTLLCLCLALSATAQSRRPLFYAGPTAGAGVTFLRYTELHDQQQKIRPSYLAGLELECHPVDMLSIGLVLAYSHRSSRLEFDTPYLLDFSTVAVTNIAYTLSASGLEAWLPIAWHFGRPRTWLRSYGRLHAFAAPFLFLPLNGSVEWTRTHLADGQAIGSHRLPLSSSSHSPYDYGVKAGLGIDFRLAINRSHCIVRARLSLCYGIPDTFSDAEKNTPQEVHFLGLGDIQHETLGERRIRQVSLSVTVALPVRPRPADACWIIDH